MKKERAKRSIVWHKYSDNEFSELVKKSKTYSEILRYFGLCHKGGNSKTVKARIESLGISTDHIPKGFASNVGRKFQKTKTPIEDVLVENSSYNRANLKPRLIVEMGFEEKCQKCGMGNVWNGERLVLTLDHIDGVFNNNKIENLRFLCPNCNSQTKTFAGRNIRRKAEKFYCPKCGKEKNKASELCSVCDDLSRRKVIRPSKEQLTQDIQELPMTTIGKKYNVSDNAVRKWAKGYGIHIVTKKELRENICHLVCDDFKNSKISISSLASKYQTSHCVIKDILLKSGLVEQKITPIYKHGYRGVYYDNARKHYVCTMKNGNFLKRGFETAELASKYREEYLDGLKVTE
jgi:Zn finger protein HypA/HybF involved in hydrogenase expression